MIQGYYEILLTAELVFRCNVLLFCLTLPMQNFEDITNMMGQYLILLTKTKYNKKSKSINKNNDDIIVNGQYKYIYFFYFQDSKK